MRWAHSFTKMELRYTPCVSVMHFHELYYCMPVSCVSTTTCRSFGAVACAGPGRRPHGASGMTLIPLLCLRWPDTQQKCETASHTYGPRPSAPHVRCGHTAKSLCHSLSRFACVCEVKCMKKGYHPCVPGQCRTSWPVQDSACGGTVWVDVLKPVSWRAVCMPFRPVVP